MGYPDIHTPNLRLVFFDRSNDSHYDHIIGLYNDPAIVGRHNKTVTSHADIDMRKKFAIPSELCHKSPPLEYPYILCFLKDTDTYIGQISVFFRGEDPTPSLNTQMGWAFHEKYWGKGYATEALVAMLEWCDVVLGLERTSAQCAVANVASCRVAEKAGGKIRESRTDGGGSDEKEMRVYEWVFENAR